MDKKIFFIGGLIIVLLGGFFSSISFAAVPENVEPQNECRAVVLEAFTNAEVLYTDKRNKFLDNHKYSVIAKTKGENTSHYDQVFDCDIKSICSAITASTPEDEIFSDPRISGCKTRTVSDVESLLSISFDVCRQDPRLDIRAENLKKCETFSQEKLRISRREVGKEVREYSSLQVQGILGNKILAMQKRMEILLEKTRSFAINFTSTVNGFACTIPNESIPN